MQLVKKFREPVNALTHIFGAILSLIATFMFVFSCNKNYLNYGYFSLMIFGLSLILLYSASSIYHLFWGSEKVIKRLRKLDHSMIYVLIAGTYTPITLIALKGSFGLFMFFSIWAMAIIGIFLKIFWFNAPRWLYTLFYVLMGWFAAIAIVPLYKVISLAGVLLLFFGGISYTIGAVIYATQKPHLNIKFLGSHEIFHLFVILGSVLHFLMIYIYILPLLQ